MDGINLAILIGGFLFVISIIATLISARLGAPMLLVFLIIGMLAGEEGLVGIQFDNPQVAFLIGSIALVIILFDGGMRTHPERFRVALAPASMLATVGVVLTCGIVGVAAAYLLNLTLLQGLLLGAILSSTDAAAVFSIFQSQGLRIKERTGAGRTVKLGRSKNVFTTSDCRRCYGLCSRAGICAVVPQITAEFCIFPIVSRSQLHLYLCRYQHVWR